MSHFTSCTITRAKLDIQILYGGYYQNYLDTMLQRITQRTVVEFYMFYLHSMRATSSITQKKGKNLTHGKELCPLCLGLLMGQILLYVKYPKTMHNMWSYIGKLPEGYPVTTFHLKRKSSPYKGKMPLYRERITSIPPKVNPCTFITELTMNLIYTSGDHQSEV